MKRSFIIILVSLALSFLSLAMYAQDKTQAYYSQHESEILPDAQTAFSDGDYEQTVLLCRWHYIIVGDRAADSLRDKADKCRDLLEEMSQLAKEGNIEVALDKALALLALNPEDIVAKNLLLAAETANNEADDEEEIVTIPDSLTIEEIPVYDNEPEMISDTDQSNPAHVDISDTLQILAEEPYIVLTNKLYDHQTLYGIKAGLSITSFNNFIQSDSGDMGRYLAYAGSLCVYNIGKSRFGLEVGTLFVPSLSDNATFIEIDTGVVIRVSDFIFLKGLGGYYTYNHKTINSLDKKGMSVGVGVTSFMDEHFCLEIGCKFYSATQDSRNDAVNANEIQLNPTAVLSALPRGLSPYLSIGFFF